MEWSVIMKLFKQVHHGPGLPSQHSSAVVPLVIHLSPEMSASLKSRPGAEDAESWDRIGAANNACCLHCKHDAHQVYGMTWYLRWCEFPMLQTNIP